MTLTDLQKHKLYRLLSAAHKTFITKLCESGGDLEAASREAWPSSSDAKAVRASGARALKSENVERLWDLWNGEEPEPSQEEFRKHVWLALKDSNNAAAKAALLNLYAELRGWRCKGKPLGLPPANEDDILQEIQL